jgi:uncharacterized SAM-binding protein YcdF (DUF218 family)
LSTASRKRSRCGSVAIGEGIPADHIELELRARNTLENVQFVHAILERQHWKRILLVSSPYHMRRAHMVWTKSAPDIAVTPTPPPNAQFLRAHPWRHARSIRGIAWEYAAIVYYWWRGYL